MVSADFDVALWASWCSINQIVSNTVQGDNTTNQGILSWFVIVIPWAVLSNFFAGELWAIEMELVYILKTAITDKHDYTSGRKEPSVVFFRVWSVKEYKSVAKLVHQDFTYRRCKLTGARPNFIFIDGNIIPLLSGMAHRKRTRDRRRDLGVPSQRSTSCQKLLDTNLAWRA